MKRSTLWPLILMLLWPLAAFSWEEHPGIAGLFAQEGVSGTFVLCDVNEKTFVGHNRARAETRYIPASTFKIANALIGLSTGAVGSVDEVLPYNGPAEPFIPEWKADMGLRRAMALSNVPIYRELARRIGLTRMREGLNALRYGNRESGDNVTRFWLDGPLAISALEQAQFLAELVRGTLPLPEKAQADVREILLLEEGTRWKLYGKTGWQNAPGRGIGWWVGWVEMEGRDYVFALNMDINEPSDAAKRLTLGKASLKLLGLITD